MKADVIHQFIDAHTGETVPADTEVDMEQSRIERLEAAKCVRRKTAAPKPQAAEQDAEQAQEEPKPAKKPRGRPRNKAAE